MIGLVTLKSVVKAVSHLGADSGLQAGMSILGNHKTGKSLEGHRCPMMRQMADGHLTAPLCPSCYSVACLNSHPATRAYIERENQPADEIVMSAAGLAGRQDGFPVFPGERLRCYGLTDFRPEHFPMLKALSKIYQLDIISKTLWMGDRKWLLAVARLPGVNVSLSFNKEVPRWSDRLRECRKFVRDNKLRSVSFNYTFISSYRETGRSEIEPYHRIEGVKVYHTIQHSKEPLVQAIGAKGVCGIFGEDGKRVDTGTEKGSCRNCDFCRMPTVRIDPIRV